MKNFQVIMVVVFMIAALIGVLVFSGAIPIGNSTEDGALGTVVLWGNAPSSILVGPIEEFNANNPSFVLKYVQKSEDSFDQELLEGLASGRGPDLVLMTNDLIFHYRDKIIPIPYTSYPVASFKSTFAGAGEVFLNSKGILALPLSIDPIMMYYNRSILDANEIVYPPVYWNDLINIVPLLTKKDDSNKISKSTIAFGHFLNIAHSKDIIATLFMQAGNSIIKEEKDGLISTLDSSIGASSALQFYTDFANPNNAVYSWNKSFPNSRDVFSKEDLAFYLGYGSEFKSLVNKNPNQNFFIAPLPQIKNSTFKLTGAKVTGVAVLSSSKNVNAAFSAANLLASTDFASKFSVALGIAPARRDLLAIKPADSHSPIFYNSALFARSWLDPSPKETDVIFNGMINNILSNNMGISSALQDANSKMNLLLLK